MADLERHGIRYFFQPSISSINPSYSNRIRKFANLPSLAIVPLLQLRDELKPSRKVIVNFLNDIALCSSRILESVLQHERLMNAAMTCAMA